MSERDAVLLDLRERLRFYGELTTIGLDPQTLGAAKTAVGSGPGGAEAPAAGQAALGPAEAAAAGPRGDATGALQQVRDTLGDCRRCKLQAGRKTIVFGQGNPNARLMFVGEAPGADEDEQGLAFVGRAGQLLTDIIEKGLKLPRSEVFIANVIKCRPPQNRNPEPDEILACQPFLEGQIDAIKPRVIVGLGKFGAQFLLKTAEPITRLRGKIGEYRGITVMPTYHPAYLLRNPAAKKDVWLDMQAVMRLLEG
ncbi:MAG: uracil-DNA glycosylase [Vicinamibacteria bacterium]